MYGMQQIGDGNLNYENNEHMNYPHGPMQQRGSQFVYNNVVNHQPEIYQNINSGNINDSSFNNRSQSNCIGHPSMQDSVYTNNPASNYQLAQNKNTNNDPLSDLFG